MRYGLVVPVEFAIKAEMIRNEKSNSTILQASIEIPDIIFRTARIPTTQMLHALEDALLDVNLKVTNGDE